MRRWIIVQWPRKASSSHHESSAADIEAFGDLGDYAGQAHAHLDFGWTCERQSDHGNALDHAQQAVTLFQAAGHRPGQAHSLTGIGWCYAQLGNHHHALIHCQRALALFQEIGDPDGEANTWDSLGYGHHHLGQHSEAIDCYQRSLDLCRDFAIVTWRTTYLRPRDQLKWVLWWVHRAAARSLARPATARMTSGKTSRRPVKRCRVRHHLIAAMACSAGMRWEDWALRAVS